MLGNFIANQQGFNYNSPTANYVTGGMYNNIPPNPIGNTLNVGGMGYNNPYVQQQNFGMMNGYYNQQYNISMNPYLYQQQLKAQEAAQKEQMRQRSDMMKRFSRTVHKSIGDLDKFDNFDEFLNKQYDPVETHYGKTQYEIDADHYNHLSNLVPITPDYNYINRCNTIHESYRKRFPSNMGLSDFLDNAGTLILEDMVSNNNKLNRNGKLRYDSDNYKKILDSHKSCSNYFNSALLSNRNSSINIDDMEIELPSNSEDKPKMVINCPSHMQEYNARRQAFLNALLNNK